MDFLDNIVLPQSAHHMELLRGLLSITLIILIPYLSVLTGSLIFSILYLKKKKTSNNNYNYRFAKELIDLSTFNKSVAFGFGVIPFISAIFAYAQLLDKTSSYLPYYVSVAFVFFLIALLFIYTYKYAFHLKDIFNFVSTEKIQSEADESTEEEFEKYSSAANRIFKKFAGWGLLFLLIADYKLISSIQLSLNPGLWEPNPGFWSVLFSIPALVNFFNFLIVSLALTSIIVLYVYFRPNSIYKRNNDEYLSFVKQFALKSSLLFSLFVPVVIVLNILVLPTVALTNAVFLISLIAIILVLITGNYLYIMMKEGHLKYVPAATYVFILVIALIIFKNEYAFESATKKHFVVLATNYEEYSQKLKAELGGKEKTVSGEEIYKTRCMACHRFETKLVGPPHLKVLPKYEGKEDKLIKFILNPVKVDPAYPSMPNQGLKPNEAKAVADYMLKVYEEKKKK